MEYRYNTAANEVCSLLTGVAVCVNIPEFLFGVKVGVKEKVNSQLKTLFGHRLVVWMLELRL